MAWSSSPRFEHERGDSHQVRVSVKNHEHAVALHYMHYNFCRRHQTLRVTPTMEAGVADNLWNLEEVVSLLDSQTATDAA